MGSSFGLKFWGTKGLISSPHSSNIKYGGNTPCIEVLNDDNHIVLIDTGFGASILGEQLQDRILKAKEKLEIHIFYTHFHWDHIQGLPFFFPIYFPTTTLNLYSPEPRETMIENLDVLFDGSYSPFSGIKNMPSNILFNTLNGPLCLGSLTVDYHPVDHGEEHQTIGKHDTYAYKITHKNGDSICVVTDHEAKQSARNKAVVEFAKGCQLLVHDGQYSDEEYADKIGWGHSVVTQALENARKIGPLKTLLTHHDPRRNDLQIEQIHANLQGLKRYSGMNFEFAQEQHEYKVAQLTKPSIKAS